MKTDRCLVIAEAGVNHNGSLALARRLVDVAADSGADVVKFQSFKAEKLVTRRARKANYQVENTGTSGDQLEMLRALELDEGDHQSLVEHCAMRGIRFMSTAFDSDSLAYLAGLDMPAFKIPSGDLTFSAMLLQTARLGRPIIVSTGMATLGEIDAALTVLAWGLIRPDEPASWRDLEEARFSAAGQDALRRRVTLLHCTTEYPAPASAVNLRAMDTMAGAFGLRVGYSDHTLGTAVSIAAVARGASVVEKHFTLDRGMEGPDHAASLEPSELKSMVDAIRTVEACLGSPRKQPSEVELGNRLIARRSLVAARSIAAGEPLTIDMFDAKRPSDGLAPVNPWALVGQAAAKDYQPDDPIIA